MSDLLRSGDDDKDMEAWMRRTAAMLARLLVEQLSDEGKTDVDSDPSTAEEREG
jgi:hypothetical protein